MRWSRLVFSFCFVFSLSVPLEARQAPSSPSPQAVTILRNSLAALVGHTAVTDITLTGSARRIAGSDDESGPAVLKGVVAGAARVELSLPSGSRSDFSNISTAPHSGTWSGSDGVSHAVSFHNLLSDPTWFFPAFGIARGLNSPNHVTTYVGQETQNSQTVYHIAIQRTLPNAVGDTQFFEHLSRTDLYVDSATLLPVALKFNVHPDGNAAIDIPVEITYADYREVNGIQIPFHIEKYLNGSLFLDLQFSTANLNSGLTASALAVQ